MDFNELDIDKMFEAAAGAAEDTGEKDPALLGKKEQKIVVKEDTVPEKTEKRKQAQETIQPEEKFVVPKPKPFESFEQKKEPVRERLGPRIGGKNTLAEGITINSIQKIIEMKAILEKYKKDEVDFAESYFNTDSGNTSDLIYRALNANVRSLEALDNIVEAKGKQSAERAFYLMELGIGEISSIIEQINLLTGALDEYDRVTETNKITACRELERIISEMDNNIFIYIEKLQLFTNKAIS